MNERDLFLSALEIEVPEARRAHLQSACGDDAELLARVESLLESHESQSRFLNTPAVQQMTAEPTSGKPADQPPPTLLFGAGSTQDGRTEEFMHNPNDPDTVFKNDEEQAEEIPLGYLEPSDNPDSLGRLGHYEVQEILGRGAFGIVLKAFDERLLRVVAIKVLAPEMAATSPARKRFLREARASAAVRHEHVVAIHAVEDEPIPYLVMEYVPGETLQKRLDDHGPLDLQDALKIGKQIAEGLTAAHDEQLIHRDIKPGNVLLETSVNDHVKITDFGLARTADDASVTKSGFIAGTPMYMAPEQALGQKLDQRADLFSFGSVLYQMLSGRPPFRAPSTVAVLKRVAEDTPRPIPEIIPEVPEWMCEIVGHLHAKDPDNRYASAKEVAELLHSCLEDLNAGRIPENVAPVRVADEPGEREAPVSRPVEAKPALPRSLTRVAVAALILLVGLGVTEATGVTRLGSTVVRLATGSGILVIESDDPGVKIAIDGAGEEITVTGAGVEELTLRPGEYKVAAFKDGKPIKRELVSITRNGRTAVRMTLEPSGSVARPTNTQPAASDQHGWPADAPSPAIAPFDAEQAAQHQQTWADHLGVPVAEENSIGMKLRLIPPGRFLMRPEYDVTITKPLRFGTCEVTIAQFRAFVDETGYRTSAEVLGNGQRVDSVVHKIKSGMNQQAEFTWRHEDVHLGDDYPVAQLSWEDAAAFCEWLSGKEGRRYRLPAEAEWEWACRAGNLHDSHFANDPEQLGEHVWHAENSESQAHPVGLKKPNPWGLCDMLGNVCEYCLDWHARSLPGQLNDPRGPNDGQLKVVRGGGFIAPPEKLTLHKRGTFSPTGSLNHFGFRVVCELVPDPPAAVEAGLAP